MAKYLTLLAVLFRLDTTFPYLHLFDMLTDDTENFQDSFHLHTKRLSSPHKCYVSVSGTTHAVKPSLPSKKRTIYNGKVTLQ